MLATRGKVPKRPRGARVLELDVKFIFLKVIPKAKFYNFLNKQKTTICFATFGGYASDCLFTFIFLKKFNNLLVLFNLGVAIDFDLANPPNNNR